MNNDENRISDLIDSGHLSQRSGFIAQTAFDYDMDYNDVESIYDEFEKSEIFYEKLEEFINSRHLN